MTDIAEDEGTKIIASYAPDQPYTVVVATIEITVQGDQEAVKLTGRNFPLISWETREEYDVITGQDLIVRDYVVLVDGVLCTGTDLKASLGMRDLPGLARVVKYDPKVMDQAFEEMGAMLRKMVGPQAGEQGDVK